MAVESTATTTGPLPADGATTVFDFTFQAASADEVGVAAYDADAVLADLPSFTVTITESGGSLIFESAPADGLSIYIYSEPDFRQQIEFGQGSRWLASPVNEANDRSALRDLYLKDRINRAPVVPIGGGVDGKFPVVLPGGDFGWSSGTGTDVGLRTDLAGGAGAEFVGIGGDESLADFLTRVDLTELIYWAGNSIVQAPYALPDVPAPAVLEAALAADGYSVSVYNEGGSGETAWQIMTRVVGDLGSTGELRPKVAIIGPAGVNSFRKVDDDEDLYGIDAVKDQYQAMFDAAKDAGAYVVVLLDLPWKGYVDTNPDYSWTLDKQDLTDELNTWLLAYPDNVDAVVANSYTEFEGVADTIKPLYSLGDGLHINQAGRNMLSSMAKPLVGAVLSTPARVARFVGSNFVGDQDVSTKGAPHFNSGLAVARNQLGFEVFGPAFRVVADEDGHRAVAISTRWDSTSGANISATGRVFLLDGLFPIIWQGLGDDGEYKAQAAIGIDDYGTGTGYLWLGASDGSQINKVAWINIDANFSIGYKSGRRKLTVSNDGAECFEVGPGDANGDSAGKVTLIAIDRTVDASPVVIPIVIQGEKVTLKDETGAICLETDGGRVLARVTEYADDAAAGAAGLTTNQLFKKPDGSVWAKS